MGTTERTLTIEPQDLDRAVKARNKGNFNILTQCVFAQALVRHGIALDTCAGIGYFVKGEEHKHRYMPTTEGEQGTLKILVDNFDNRDYAAVRGMLPVTLTFAPVPKVAS
jgi:hypothetical protein